MQIEYLISNRNCQPWVSWYVVHEWEDIFIKELNLKLTSRNSIKNKILTKLCNINLVRGNIPFLFNNNKPVTISFIMNLNDLDNFRFSRINLVPIFIDIWKEDIEVLLKISQKFVVFFVTSKEVFDELSNMINNVLFIPLSVSDIWKKNTAPLKTIDVIQVGRKNSILHTYMMSMVGKYPSIEYVYQERSGNNLYYISSKHGELGGFNSRSAYMNLLSSAKVSLVSAPGLDNSRDTGGINPVTPRFFESAAQFTHMVGRYPENADFISCGIEKICHNVDNYNQFETLIHELLKRKVNTKKLKEFLSVHYTTKRAETIRVELQNLKLQDLVSI